MNRKVLAALTAAAVLVGFGIAAGAGAEGAPLSVLSALSSADGAQVILTGVVIDKVVTDPPYVVVREPWSSEIRLIVLLDAPAEVQRWQTVDVTGVMSTLPSDERALSSSSISVYKDTSGRTALIPLPVFPGDESFVPDEAPLQPLARGEQQMMEVEAPPVLPSPNPPADGYVVCESIADALAQGEDAEVRLNCKPIEAVGQSYFIIGEDDTTDTLRVNYSGAVVDTDRVVTVTGAILGSGQLAVTGGTSRVILAEPGSIAHAKTLPDGGVGTVSDQVVSLVLPNDLCFYTQEADRSAGIRVSVSSMPSGTSPGDVVNVTGAMGTTASGERYVTGTSIQQTSGPGVPNPLGVTNDVAGGGDWYVTPEAGQVGPAAPEHLNNVGLFVKTSGRVVDIESGLLKIDDGSCGAAPCPLWVLLPSGVTLPVEGDYVIVTGASSLKGTASAPERLVRVATADDIQSGCWDDTDDPVVAITSPGEDGATAETFEAISGTASDTSRVTKVEVQINGGSWTEATYTPSTHSWARPWAPARDDYTISVRAYDCNGHVATVTRSVSLVDVEITPGAPERCFLPGTVISWPAQVNAYPTGAAGGNGVLRKAPASQTGYDWDAFTLARLKEASLGSLRFGDMATNHYNWRFGVGPKAERPPVWVPEVNYFSLHAYGIAEHVELCEKTGATPIVAVAYWNADESLAINAARNLVFFANAAYQGKLNTNWAVTTVNRHMSECDEYAERGYTLSEKVKRNTGDMPDFKDQTNPAIDLAFRCTQTYATYSADRAPGSGQYWQQYWEAMAPTEEKPGTGVSYLTTDDVPTDQWELAHWPQYWAWVRHELSARDTPLGITYWEIGNQIFSTPFGIQPADYRDSLEDFRAAMISADGNIEVGACVPTWREAQYDSWPGVVLDAEPTRPYDFAIPHFYVGAASPTAGIDALFANTMPRINYDLDVYSEASSGLARIWSTEVNTRFGLYEGSNTADIPDNFMLKSALACAAAQLTLAGRGAMGSDVFTAAAVSNGTATSVDARDLRLLAVDQIKDTESGVAKPSQRQWVTPTYHVQKLLGHFAQENPITTACASPVLVAQAFKTTDFLRLFIVNTDPEDAQTARVYLAEGINPAGPAVLYQLSGTNGMESTNECGQGTQVHDPAVSFTTVSGNILSFEVPAASLTVYDIALNTTPHELRGVVTDLAGRPIPDAPVRVSDTVTWTEYTDSFGVYEFMDLPQGDYAIEVQPGAYIVAYGEADLTQAQDAVASFTLTPRLSGTVKRPAVFPETEPQPVAGAAVWAVPSGGGDAITTVSDCVGNFVLPVVAGTYDVRAQHLGYGVPYAFEDADVTATSLCVSFVLATNAQPEECE